jgi:hypothetical protein
MRTLDLLSHGSRFVAPVIYYIGKNVRCFTQKLLLCLP